MCADNTILYFLTNDPNEMQTVLQQELNSTSKWLVNNKLCLNVQETKTILIGSARRLGLFQEFDLIGDTIFEQVFYHNVNSILIGQRMLTLSNFYLKELMGERECLGIKLLLILINYPRISKTLILFMYLNANWSLSCIFSNL